MNKWVKIGLIGVMVIAVVAVLYFVLRKTYTGNKYGSAAAVEAGTKGTYGAYNTSASTYDYQALYNGALGIGGDYSPGVYNVDAYGQAWFKGMNIQLNAANIDRFKTEVKKYADNAALRKAHWQVATGEFLSSTATPSAAA